MCHPKGKGFLHSFTCQRLLVLGIRSHPPFPPPPPPAPPYIPQPRPASAPPTATRPSTTCTTIHLHTLPRLNTLCVRAPDHTAHAENGERGRGRGRGVGQRGPTCHTGPARRPSPPRESRSQRCRPRPLQPPGPTQVATHPASGGLAHGYASGCGRRRVADGGLAMHGVTGDMHISREYE